MGRDMVQIAETEAGILYLASDCLQEVAGCLKDGIRSFVAQGIEESVAS